MYYDILDGPGGNRVSTIDATEKFMAANYAHYAVSAHQPPAPVPRHRSVTPRQARLQLLQTAATDASDNMLAQAEAIFDAMSEPQKTAAKIEWEYGTEVRRDSPLIAQLASTIGLTEQQIDAMFLAAAQL